jgi:hypothetical protein
MDILVQKVRRASLRSGGPVFQWEELNIRVGFEESLPKNCYFAPQEVFRPWSAFAI